jgi:hypothetical protein
LSRKILLIAPYSSKFDDKFVNRQIAGGLVKNRQSYFYAAIQHDRLLFLFQAELDNLSLRATAGSAAISMVSVMYEIASSAELMLNIVECSLAMTRREDLRR